MPQLNSNGLTSIQQTLTDNCTARIKQEIEHSNGSIGFDHYMQLALHDPAVGYYHNQENIFGELGDFVTASETSAHLAYCLAHACAKLIRDDNKRVILEIGAGSGRMARDIIAHTKFWGQMPSHYYIYEPSETLRKCQQEFIEQEIPEHAPIFEWLPDLTKKFETAIIIANEVLDVLPVKCFMVNSHNIKERCVSLSDDNEFAWQLQKPSNELDAALDFLTVMLNEPLTENYTSEINLEFEKVLSAWTECCYQSILFLIDYGYPRSEYYHPQRNMGTLRCYYKHQVSESPFTNPGLQDITADVDFSTVARAAEFLNIGLLSFGSLRNFMLANNLLDWQPNTEDEVERLAQIAALKQLTLGSAISERFHVMVLGKGIDYGADRFTLRDMRARL